MRPKVDLSLEIGLAAGGSFKLVRDFVEVDRSIVIDDAQHDKFKNHWNRIKKQARTNITHEIIMSSHTLECAHELKKAVGDEKFDYIFIDADHTYQGILLDIQLVLPYMRKDTLLGFHDTIKSPLERIKVREALAYYVSQGILRVLKEYNTEYGLMIVAPV